ncbi:hypothetical protein LP416_13330 [Polaromonas sp. P2-4]|nr:hypothetical protein LP416_13330 [Polaromonas sp. P2-4]
MKAINALSFTVPAIFAVSVAVGQTDPVAKLEIRVVKRIYTDANQKPFPGVGLFDLIRGRAKLEGASCPDKSNASGTVYCSIKCRGDEKDPVTIRVQPPTNQDHLAGWVTPPGTDVELRGCALSPSVITARYEDARYALNNALLENKFAVAPLGSGSVPTAWKDLLKNPSPVYGSVATCNKDCSGT